MCALGEGRALWAGRDFSRFAPSSRVRGPLASAPGLLAGWGARVAGEGALAAHGGGEGRKLSKEGQKGWGRRNWLFCCCFSGFFAFSNKRFWKTDRSWEPPSPESPSPHAPTFCNLSLSLPSRISGTGGRDAAELGRAAMFPGAPAVRPSPTEAADPARRGPWCLLEGTRARTGAAKTRRRGPGDPVWRGRGGPGALDPLGPAGHCLSSPFALLSRRETQPQGACHSRGAGAAVPGAVPVARLSGAELPFCHRGCCRSGGGWGGGERLAPSSRRLPSSEVASGGAGPRDTPSPLLHSVLWRLRLHARDLRIPKLSQP